MREVLWPKLEDTEWEGDSEALLTAAYMASLLMGPVLRYLQVVQ